MFGVTQAESLLMFPASIETYGLRKSEQEDILLRYFKNVFIKNHEMDYDDDTKNLLTMVLNEYTDYRSSNPSSADNRDTLLEIFSDAKVVAPLFKTAAIHAKAKPNSTFVYVFEHTTKFGHFSEVIYTTLMFEKT